MTAWPGLSQGDFDTRSGRKASVAQSLTDATEHCQEVAYVDGTHSPTEAHVHDGTDSNLVVMPDVPNLISDAHPQATQAHNDVNNWSRNGVGVDTHGLNFRQASSYASIKVGDNGNVQQFAGADVVLALLVRSRVPLTAATFNFGIVDGHTSTFGTGLKASVDQDSIPVGGYRRLYTVIRDFDSTAFGTNVSMGISLSGSFTTSSSNLDKIIDVTAVLLKPCSVLPQWEPGYYVKRQHNWELIGMGEVPLWDDVLNFDRAKYVAPA